MQLNCTEILLVHAFFLFLVRAFNAVARGRIVCTEPILAACSGRLIRLQNLIFVVKQAVFSAAYCRLTQLASLAKDVLLGLQHRRSQH